jgi:hypothetical protein
MRFLMLVMLILALTGNAFASTQHEENDEDRCVVCKTTRESLTFSVEKLTSLAPQSTETTVRFLNELLYTHTPFDTTTPRAPPL